MTIFGIFSVRIEQVIEKLTFFVVAYMPGLYHTIINTFRKAPELRVGVVSDTCRRYCDIAAIQFPFPRCRFR